MTMKPLLKQLLPVLRSDDGPTAVEYAVLLGVIAVGTLAAMATFGVKMEAIYTIIASAAGAL